jgi:hypothetical protein
VNLDPRDPSNLPLIFGLLDDRKRRPSEPSGCGCEGIALVVALVFCLALLRSVF